MRKDRKQKSTLVGTSHNAIGEGTVITGDLITKGDVRLDGIINGNVNIEGRLVMGSEGAVEGTLTCVNADIEGRIEGEITVEDMLTLKSTAIINGHVHTSKLTVEPGAEFNATCTMGAKIKDISNGGQNDMKRQAKG